jgi:hypothetical protein
MGRRWRRKDQRAAMLAVASGLVLAAVAHFGVPSGAPAAPASVSGNVALGQKMAAADGWAGAQWTCLYDLWERESGWSNTAENASDAYGIAQALGHGPTNQYPAGPANPPVSNAPAQIGWGLGYIRATYGDPCAAWSHETADSWY